MNEWSCYLGLSISLIIKNEVRVLVSYIVCMWLTCEFLHLVCGFPDILKLIFIHINIGHDQTQKKYRPWWTCQFLNFFTLMMSLLILYTYIFFVGFADTLWFHILSFSNHVILFLTLLSLRNVWSIMLLNECFWYRLLIYDAVCWFYRGSLLCHRWFMVPAVWDMLVPCLYMLLLLSKRALWLF